MPHGYPDYGVAAPKRTVYALQDMAELAARLGSIVTFDRGGDVQWLDYFQATTLHWETYLDGTGAAAELSTAWALWGERSLKLTAGSSGYLYSQAWRNLILPVKSRLGLEAAFSVSDNTDYIQIDSELFDGTTMHYFSVRYRHQAQDLQLLTHSYQWTTFATGVRLWAQDGLFNIAKMVFDLQTDRYVRFLLNHESYDLSPYTPVLDGSDTPPCNSIGLGIWGLAGYNPYTYFDAIIFTQNEP